MFDAAREGNAELLLAAIDAGLPPNLTNPKGTSSSVQFTVVSYIPHSIGSARAATHYLAEFESHLFYSFLF
jgi:hypothetical protein